MVGMWEQIILLVHTCFFILKKKEFEKFYQIVGNIFFKLE
jgi:hypothetical protein